MKRTVIIDLREKKKEKRDIIRTLKAISLSLTILLQAIVIIDYFTTHRTTLCVIGNVIVAELSRQISTVFQLLISILYSMFYWACLAVIIAVGIEIVIGLSPLLRGLIGMGRGGGLARLIRTLIIIEIVKAIVDLYVGRAGVGRTILITPLQVTGGTVTLYVLDMLLFILGVYVGWILRKYVRISVKFKGGRKK